MRHRTEAAGLLLIVVAGLLAVPAAAPARKHWKAFNDKPAGDVSIASTNEIGFERTSDGVLHVLWVNNRADATQALLHTAVSDTSNYAYLDVSEPDLVMSVNTAAAQGLNDSVDLVAAPGGGLRALFSTLFPSSPFDGILATSTSADGGSTWSAATAASATAPAQRSPVYAASGIAGATDSAGSATGAWGDSSPDGGGYRVGLTTNGADARFSNACCEIDPGVAFDSVSGEGYVAANLEDTAIKVIPLGAGPTLSVPQSAHAWTVQRTSITGRIGADGVYVGYGTGENMFNARPAIWRVGDSKVIVLKNQDDATHVGIAPAPDGRLWVYWERDGVIYISRTNPEVTKFGAIVQTNAPKPGDTVYRLAGEGSEERLYMLALDGPPGNGSPNWWVRAMYAGLTCKVLGNGKVKAGKKITFRVTDAGDPVKGADFFAFIDGDDVFTPSTNAAGKTKLKIPKDARAEEEKAIGGASNYEVCEAHFEITH